MTPHESQSCNHGAAASLAFAAPLGSTDDIVMELKLPVPVKELAAVTDALCKIHGKNKLFMRQVGPMLQLYKPGLHTNEPIQASQTTH